MAQHSNLGLINLGVANLGDYVAAGGGGGSIELGHIASTLVLYGPTPLVAVAPGYIASGAVLYEPVVGYVEIGLPHIATTLAVYAPAVSSSILLDAIASGTTLYAPAVSSGVLLGFIAGGSTVYAPIPVPTILLAHIGSGTTLSQPTLLVGILPGAIAGTAALYPFVLGSAANVSGLLYNTGGYELFNGTVTITSPQMRFGAITYLPGSAMYRVTNGAFSADLIPNAGATPAGTKYRVIFQPKQTASRAISPWVEEWTVGSAGFLTLDDVRA